MGVVFWYCLTQLSVLGEMRGRREKQQGSSGRWMLLVEGTRLVLRRNHL